MTDEECEKFWHFVDGVEDLVSEAIDDGLSCSAITNTLELYVNVTRDFFSALEEKQTTGEDDPRR